MAIEIIMKVLFLYPNMSGMMIPPAGISSLSAYLKSKGVEVDIFDTTFYKTSEKTSDERRIEVCQVRPFKYEDVGIEFKKTDMLQDFYDKMDEFQPDVLGVSVNDFTINMAKKLIKGIHDKYPKIHVILGGIFPTFFPECSINIPDVDSICISEGYQALYNITYNIVNGLPIDNISNTWIKKDGNIIKNPISNPIDINNLPYDDFDIYDKKRFYRPMQGKMFKMLPFWLDMGCPYNCTYCVAPTLRNMYSGSSYFRVKTVDRIMGELHYQVEKHTPNYLYCSTENFFSRPKSHIEKFSKRYKEEIGLPFWCESRVETITDENIKTLVDMGCDRISIGLESGDEDYRVNTLQKTFTNEQFFRAIEVLNRHKLKCTVNNMIGFPNETRDMIFKTINANRKIIEDCKDIDITMTVSTYVPCGGSGLQKYCVSNNLFDLDEYLNNPPETFHGGFYLKNPNLSKKEIDGIYRTFSLYVRLDSKYYDDIKKAENITLEGDDIYEQLKKIYWKVVK